MKKTTFFIILFSVLLRVSSVHAQTPSPAKPTSESVTEKLSDQINSLKGKIASRVAQLKLVEKRGVIGSVKEVTGTKLTLIDISGKTKLVDVDEITKFSSPSAKDSFGISDLKPGTKLSVIGLYNKDSEHLLARFIKVMTLPIAVNGAVSDSDKVNFTLTVAAEDGKQMLVDIENLTKMTSYTGDMAEKIGFSKIEKGVRTIVIGFADLKEKNRMVGTRVLLFPALPKNPKLVIPDAAVDTSEGVVTSSGSGKKLTPIR